MKLMPVTLGGGEEKQKKHRDCLRGNNKHSAPITKCYGKSKSRASMPDAWWGVGILCSPNLRYLQLRKLSESDTANFSVALFQTLAQSGPDSEDKDTGNIFVSTVSFCQEFHRSSTYYCMKNHLFQSILKLDSHTTPSLWIKRDRKIIKSCLSSPSTHDFTNVCYNISVVSFPRQKESQLSIAAYMEDSPVFCCLLETFCSNKVLYLK